MNRSPTYDDAPPGSGAHVNITVTTTAYQRIRAAVEHRARSVSSFDLSEAIERALQRDQFGLALLLAKEQDRRSEWLRRHLLGAFP